MFYHDRMAIIQQLGVVRCMNYPQGPELLIHARHNDQPLYNIRYIMIERRLFRFNMTS